VTRPELGVQVWGASSAALAEKAARVEALGFDAVTVPDHLVDGLPPPFLACAVIAQATSRVRLGPLVLNNDLRHPVLVARGAAQLADLSGDRFELGLGAGYARDEYERAGIPYDPPGVRVARLAEATQVVRRLLAGEEVAFAGTHYTLRGERCWPVPARPVPILLGGNSRALHACAAAHADVVGLVGFRGRTGGPAAEVTDFAEADLARQLARLDALAAGRDAPLGRQVLVQAYEVTDDRAAALERLADDYGVPAADLAGSPYLAVGTADEIAHHLLDLHRRHGIGRFTVFADKPDAPPLETLAPVVERLRAAA
jgi:probable F420-dependent oxidoreductase